MAQRAGRVVCPRCGANNFDTVTVCWKCGAPMSGGAAAAAPMARPAATSAGAQAPLAEPFVNRGIAVGSMVVNTATANRAAVWLGLLFPYFGLPIALAFMMCDDPRRQEVGRICLLWSIISSIVHILFMFAAMLGMREMLFAFINGLKGARGGGLGGGLE